MEKFIKNFFIVITFVGLISCDGNSPKFNPNGHEYVDLGLPSKTLWGTCNIGAVSPEQCGNYYAYGEIYIKETYRWTNYKWCNGSDHKLTKYNTLSSYGNSGFTDNKTILELSDDAAYFEWRGSWRTPTRKEFQELIDCCEWVWEQRNGVNGSKVIGPNGNSIFLPAGGWWYNKPETNLDGLYLCSEIYSDDPKYSPNLHFNKGNVYLCYGSRESGYTIRAVCAK